ncbi:MAG TPA: UvrD-helicase domain-containing protein [Solirubrobacteraceae bacterium]|jgi:exodeoxyribonuclease V beta subunit
MSVATPTEFDVCGPLPTGVTVLEASAGTGKTYTIAALAARYVAEEGVPLSELLLVTFTRMATGELRERVRERFVGLEAALERVLAGQDPASFDRVVRTLAAGPREQTELRRERLVRALADFDAATIATTHGFCQEALSGLGVAADTERDREFVEDVRDLVEQVVDDLYVLRFKGTETPSFDRAQALRIAGAAVDNFAAPIEPRDAEGRSPGAMRRRLAEAVRAELAVRKRRLGVMTYDDLPAKLGEALADDDARDRLRARYRIVLVDEFQDTDPVQWEIMRRAFGEGGTLVLIGDPKQAIYAFRGADVYAYLAAAGMADRPTLRVNWRSDQHLLDAYDALFGDAKLGHAGIEYRVVRAAEANREPRLHGAPVPAPLRVRLVSGDAVGRTAKGYVETTPARRHVACDVAADLAELLRSGATLEVRDKEGRPLDPEPVRPGHVAVLVRRHREAELVRAALEEAGIPAVINGAGSVFATDPARDWLDLLSALERPADDRRAHAAALTSLIGWSAERVACAEEGDWEEVHEDLHEWAVLLRERGVASLMETIIRSKRVPARLLARTDGERWLTDLRHVGQLLHAAATAEELGVSALTAWLRRRIADAESDRDEERSRRLESDAAAVQVLTIHRSKGLEFPVVYCPYLWDHPGGDRARAPVAFHDESGARVIDVGLQGREYEEHRRRHEEEERGEDLRLMYVALTRAQHQAVIWWAGTFPSRDSPLCRLLFGRDEDGTVKPSLRQPPDDPTARARFETLAASAPEGRISVEDARVAEGARWSPPAADAAELAVAAFRRSLDEQWRRTSYTALTAGSYEARVASEPEEPVVLDEPVTAGGQLSLDAPGGASPLVLASAPAGVEFGTFVHRLLEAADFAAPDLAAELRRHTKGATDVGPLDDLVAGMAAAIETPLGPLVGGARLRDVPRADRLDELAFELPLVGGDDAEGTLTLRAIAGVLRTHLPAGEPLLDYADRLEDPALEQTVRGYLTGSIDLVARVGGRFAVIDYKTNWLGEPDEPLTAGDYRPAALDAAMRHSHYVLQGLLYTAALHRYLRWRLPGYDPERHLAGILYLFVRGMTGAEGGGVWAWRPPASLVGALSNVLDRGGVG